jgi:hypothetical protein
MKKVICIDDKNLPTGAEIVEGEVYIVRESFVNSFDQRAYMLKGIRNLGRTQFGLPWQGYRSDRFEIIEGKEEEQEQVFYAFN